VEPSAPEAPADSDLAFGSPLLRQSAFGGRLVFAGTETEDELGHMEGAVVSGMRTAQEVSSTIAVSGGVSL